jgi:hypothetical protein
MCPQFQIETKGRGTALQAAIRSSRELSEYRSRAGGVDSAASYYCPGCPPGRGPLALAATYFVLRFLLAPLKAAAVADFVSSAI